MVAGIGVGDAAAARGKALESAFEERLEKNEEGARPCHLLCFEQLLAAAELTRSDVVLHLRDHHGNDCPRLGDAGGLSDHSDFHDLGFDLTEAGLETSLTGTLGDQD